MRLTIKAKLIAAFAAVIILSAVSMGIALMNLGALNASFSAAMEGNVKRIQLASDLEVSTLKVARDEKNLILTQDPAAIATLVGQMDAEIDAVHTDTATGNAGDGGGSRETRRKDELVDLRLGHLLQIGFGDETVGNCLGLDALGVEATAVVGDADDDVAAFVISG